MEILQTILTFKMKKYYWLICCLFLTSQIFAQKDLNLDFEIVALDGNYPIEWKSTGVHIGFLDEKIKKHGINSIRLELPKGAEPNEISYYSQTLVLADKTAKEIVFRAYVKTEDAKSAGLFLRCQSGTYYTLQTTNFDKMDGRRLSGTNDWTPLLIRLPFLPNLYQIEFGVYVEGKGKVWADDCKLLMDGKLHNLLPERERNPTPETNDKNKPYYVKKAAEEQQKRDAEKQVRKNKN